MSRVLGIDPATKCGWALLDNGARVASGTWDLSTKQHESKGMRFLKLERFLEEAITNSKPDLVAFEMTGHLKGHANEVYFGIVGIIKLVCERHELDYTSIQNSEVKKLATGVGNANKQAMVLAAKLRWGLSGNPTEDEADALWVALAGSDRLVA